MGTAADFEEERRELESLLDSGIFDRAPNLAQLLKYVCTKHFEGVSDQIKEYNIAVEALSRPADFDPKRDSIVRVEAHRLRRRIREFYQAGGSNHHIQIEIPPGQYAPLFKHNGVATPDSEVAEQPADLAPPPLRKWRTRMVLAACLLLIIAGLAVGQWWKRPGRPAANAVAAAPSSIPPAAAAPPAGTQPIRILAGYHGGTYLDRFGRLWQGDRFFNGGTVFDSGSHFILGTRDPRLYQTRREGNFTYDIPLAPGAYELRLHFAETLYGETNPAGGGETSRLFNFYINGAEVLEQFDVIADTGANEADIRAFKDVSPASDGFLRLKFEPHANPAFVNALEVMPMSPGRVPPILLVARDHGYTAPDGQLWEPDWCARGGQLVVRNDPVANAADPGLFNGERFGNLRYTVPVPPGKYAVTFYFSEEWFGPGKPAGGGAGSRLFDIFCNGIALRRNFDIYKEAGGANTALRVTVHNLSPNLQGKLDFALVPVRNYASIDALQVVDETRQ